MELFLNILWVAMALVGLCVWRTRWIYQRRKREHAPWLQWTAFACALVLLFFMVSLTDDLHSELVFFEECSASRRHTACVDCPHHVPQINVPAGACPSFAAPVSIHFAARISSLVPEPELLPLTSLAGTVAGRAPPAVSI